MTESDFQIFEHLEQLQQEQLFQDFLLVNHLDSLASWDQRSENS